MITEALQRQGSFSLRLRDTTPAEIRMLIRELGAIIITPTRYLGSDVSDSMVRRYAGIVLEPVGLSIAGEGLLWLLGSDTHAGDAITTPITLTGVTLSSALATLLPAGSPIVVGDVDNTGLATITTTLYMISRRAAVEQVCALAGAAFIIQPDCTIDAALPATLFPTTPTVVIMDDAASWDDVPKGIEASLVVSGRNARQYATDVTVVAQTGDGARTPVATQSGADVYLDLLGNNMVLERLVDAPTTPGASAGTVATSVLNLSTVRTTVDLACRHHDVGGLIRPGDNLYVYKPEQGFVGTAQITHKGVTITPTTAAADALTWPVTSNLGYYYRSSAGTYTDLWEYIEFEDADQVHISVGQGSTVAGDVSSISGVLGGWQDVASRANVSPVITWTPTLTNVTGGTVTAVGVISPSGRLEFTMRISAGTATAGGAVTLSLPAGLTHYAIQEVVLAHVGGVVVNAACVASGTVVTLNATAAGGAFAPGASVVSTITGSLLLAA